MVVVSVILIVNTIRVAAFSRRRETGIMKLVGASSFSIQLPFLLEGAIAGFLGAALATGAFVLIKAVLVDQILAPNFPITRFITWGDVWLSLGDGVRHRRGAGRNRLVPDPDEVPSRLSHTRPTCHDRSHPANRGKEVRSRPDSGARGGPITPADPVPAPTPGAPPPCAYVPR